MFSCLAWDPIILLSTLSSPLFSLYFSCVCVCLLCLFMCVQVHLCRGQRTTLGVCVCVGTHMCVQTRKGDHVPWSWLTSGCEPSAVDAGNWTWLSGRVFCTLNWATSPALSFAGLNHPSLRYQKQPHLWGSFPDKLICELMFPWGLYLDFGVILSLGK